MSVAGQPRVRQNDWSTLDPPLLGQWTPTLSVSVVIPSYNAQATLPATLASLAAQSYPEDLLEVIVVDDGSLQPLDLPEIRPARTRLIRTAESWGRAHACAVGADASESDVIHWLDADMVVYREHVEAQMRWHHVVDYAVVLGRKMFVDPSERGGDLPQPVEVRNATLASESDLLFEGLTALPHDWVEAFWNRTEDMRSAGPTAWTVHVGATASVHRAFYQASGGMDSALKLGEDTDLGYRLSQLGAVFIPERLAKSWHLGPSTVMRQREDVIRYNAPFLTDRISQLRYRRTSPGRQYTVPYLRAVIDVSSATWEQAQDTINALLANVDVDLEVVCVGPWSRLDDSRRSPLKDPLRELRMIAGAYSGDSRVRLVEDAPASAFPCAFGLNLPAGWRARPGILAPLLKRMESDTLGRISVLMPDGSIGLLERTAASARADRLIRHGEPYDDVMDELYGIWWGDGPDLGFEWWEQPKVASAAKAATTVTDLRAELKAAQARIAGLEAELSAFHAAAAQRDRLASTRRRTLVWRRSTSPADL